MVNSVLFYVLSNHLRMDKRMERQKAEQTRRAEMHDACEKLRDALATEYEENDRIFCMSRVNLIKLATEHIQKVHASAANSPQLTGSSSKGVIRYINSGRVCRVPPRLIPLRISSTTFLVSPPVIPSDPLEHSPVDSLEHSPVDPLDDSPQDTSSSDVWRPW